MNRWQQQHRPPGPYRSRRGAIFGVCRGLAEYFDFSVFWMRMIAVVLCLFTGCWPVLAGYILGALLMRPEPVLPLESEDDAEFYNSYTSSRSMALHRLKRTFDRLDRRIQRMEGIVTAKDYDWEQRFERDGEG